MITYPIGDVFTTTLPAVAHGVNLHGVMGSGIAKTIRALYPDSYLNYKAICTMGALGVGEMYPDFSKAQNSWLLNVASQDAPGPSARLDWLESGLEAAAHFCKEEGLEGFAAPWIGAGIGGLNKDEVQEVFERVAATFPEIDIEVWTL